MAVSRVVFLPSQSESAPLVISQDMAAGGRVVESRVGGIPGMIQNGETGYLVNVGDIDGLAAALKESLTDDARAAQYGECARSVARERHSGRSVAKQTLAAYRACLGEMS